VPANQKTRNGAFEYASVFTVVSCATTGRKLSPSAAFDSDADYLARCAFSEDFEWPAADFAVSCETLAGDARVDDQLELLPAKRALN